MKPRWLRRTGALARDEALLKGAQVDLTRYQGLAAQNAVPRQTLDTQVALVAQYQGTVEADRAAVKSAEVNLQLLPHRVAAGRPRRTAPGRPGQLCHARRRQRHRRDHAIAADQRPVHGAGRQSAGDLETPAGRRGPAGDRARSQRRQQDRRRHPADLRQPDRSDHRNDQVARAVSERDRRRSIRISSSTSVCCSTPTRTSPRCRRRAFSAACPARSSISSTPTTPSRFARSNSA